MTGSAVRCGGCWKKTKPSSGSRVSGDREKKRATARLFFKRQAGTRLAFKNVSRKRKRSTGKTSGGGGGGWGGGGGGGVGWGGGVV